MPPKQNHEFLQKWYADFKKQVYEKANIDMDQKADLGRLKIFYYNKWTVEDPLHPEGDFMFACVPHEGLQYNETPPSIKNAEEYLQWVMDKGQTPVTDEEIEKLYDQSRAGMLVALEPGKGNTEFRQIYTDENGDISVSKPVSELQEENRPNVPDEYKMPIQPVEPTEPNPRSFGLTDMPEQPEEPENMNPSFWSWLGYKLFGLDNDYAKKVQYLEDLEAYEEEIKEWTQSEQEGRPRYEAARERYFAEREAYLKASEEYLKKPLGKAFAVRNGYQFGLVGKVDDNDIGPDGYDSAQRLRHKEVEFMKKQHSKLPQGKIQTALDKSQEQIGLAKRTNKVLNGLLSHDAVPDTLVPWIKRGVFKEHQHNLKKHGFPKMRKTRTTTMAEIKEFNNHWEKLFEIAGLAALSQPDVVGTTLLDGCDAVETAKLNYSMILNDLITSGRGDSDKYMKYLEPAREKANEAITAYYAGDTGPMADLLRNSIRMTNREAANLSTLDSEHSMNTLHLISRMWEAMEADPWLRRAVNLTPEEIQETKANVAMHSVMQNGFIAKQKLLEHALYKRTLNAEEIQQAACDLMLAYQIKSAVRDEHTAMTKTIGDKPEYAEAAMGMMQPDGKEKAINRIKLIEADRPGYNIAKDLLKENWIPNAKKALLENCNLGKLSTMNREEVGKVISSQIEFEKVFLQQAPKQQAPAMEQDVVPVKANEQQMNMLG